MKRRLARFLPLLWLLFLGAQQAAFAHWAGHLAAPAVAGMESDHGESGLAGADRLCAHCAAYATLDGLAPGGCLHFSPPAAPVQRVATHFGQKSVSPIRRFLSRAPPSFS